MNDLVSKEKEIITALLRNLNEIKDFLVGEEPTEKRNEERPSKSLVETMVKNTYDLDMAYTLSIKLKEIILGEN